MLVESVALDGELDHTIDVLPEHFGIGEVLVPLGLMNHCVKAL